MILSIIFVQILLPMVESKLAFLEVQEEGGFIHSSEASKSCFGKAPKTFYAINMCLASGEFVATMINSQMLAVANINKTITASPAI